MNAPACSDSLPCECCVRPFRPADAAGIVQLVRSIYGDTYYPPELYDPARIVERNEAGTLASVVVVDEADEVVGHYAYERPHHAARVAEASDALVAVPFRHHHLLEQMRAPLREAAIRAGLTGLVGYPVTNHLFSQKADEHIGARPCGVAPGLWPRSFHNMPEPLPQRMSFVVYFRYLQSLAETVHVATPHDDMLVRISAEFGVPVRVVAAEPATGPGAMTVVREPEVETGTIHVSRVGADTAAAIRHTRAELVEAGMKAIALELPLAQPATAEVCRAAEEAGFFFCGLGPAFAADGDALLMQYLVEDLDFALIQVENPFARELLAYADRERRSGRISRCDRVMTIDR